jgi:hypothetical protein
MSDQPPVVINKPKSVWHSIFWATGLTGVGLAICVTIIALVSLSTVAGKYDRTLTWAGNLTENLKDWQQILPPALVDAVNDQRDLEYASKVEVIGKVERDDANRPIVVVTITNSGDKVVSLAALRLTVNNDRGVPRWEHTSYAATPIAADEQWRGPLLPGNTRTYTRRIDMAYYHRGTRTHKATRADVEIVELRTWVGPVKPTVADAVEKDAQSRAAAGPETVAQSFDRLSREMNQVVESIPDPEARAEARQEINEGLREARSEIEKAKQKVEKARRKSAGRSAVRIVTPAGTIEADTLELDVTGDAGNKAEQTTRRK